MNKFPRTPARPSQADALFNARLERVQSKIVHAAELIADRFVERYTDPQPEPRAPLDVRRREMANALQIWRRCPQKTCQRTNACRGEPAHCLQACMPALPPAMLHAYIGSSPRRRKRS